MKKAHLSIVLDQSSSMESVKAATISGFNEYIATLKKDKAVEYTVDLTFFDTSYTKKYSNIPLKALEPLTAQSYRPSGSTALYDAVCETIAGHEGDGGKWIVVILTDGEENASSRWNDKEFAAMVKALNAAGNVTFAFLGANQDAWTKAQQWGIHKGNAINFVSTSAGVGTAFRSMATGTSMTANMAQTSNKNFFETQKGSGLDFDQDQQKGAL